MTSMMTTSFQMLSRKQDELIHIMASDENMFNNQWFYPSNPKSESEKLDVATLPILKIGQFLPVTIEKDSYQETLEKMQNYISDYTPINELVINKGIFHSNTEHIKLSPVRGSLLRYLLEKRKESDCENKCRGCNKCFVSMNEFSEQYPNRIFEHHIAISGKMNGHIDNIKEIRKGVVDTYSVQSNIRSDLSRIKSDIKRMPITNNFKNSIIFTTIRENGTKYYGVPIPKKIL